MELAVVAARNPYKEAQSDEFLPGGAPNTVVSLLSIDDADTSNGNQGSHALSPSLVPHPPRPGALSAWFPHTHTGPSHQLHDQPCHIAA